MLALRILLIPCTFVFTPSRAGCYQDGRYHEHFGFAI